MGLLTTSMGRRALFHSVFNWAIWTLIAVVVTSQFLGIVWDSSTRFMRVVFGRSPLNPPPHLEGFNDEAYADRAIVCMLEGKTLVPKQLSIVLQDPKLALPANGSSVNGFYEVRRDTMVMSPLAYEAYVRVCDRLDFTLVAIQDSCEALGYNVTRQTLRIVDGITSDAIAKDIPRALPILMMPYWDNAVHAYYVVPSEDGAACLSQLNGVYQSSSSDHGTMRSVPRSVRVAKTEEWLHAPGGSWRNGWYEDPLGQRWLANMMTSSNKSILGLAVRHFNTLAYREINCSDPREAGSCSPTIIVETWGTQLTTTSTLTRADEVFVSNGQRFGLFVVDADEYRTTRNTYSLELFISNASIFALLLRWFVAMAAMARSYRRGLSCWPTIGIGCFSSLRMFSILPLMLLPRLKVTLLAFCTVECFFEGEQVALADAWYVMYPGIVEFLLLFFSLINIIAKVTYRWVTDAMFGPTLLVLWAIHYFREEIIHIPWLQMDDRVSTLVLSEHVDALKLVDFFTSDVTLRLNGNVRVIYFAKIVVLALNLIPLVCGERMTHTGKKQRAFAWCAIEQALALRASNVGGLGQSQVYAMESKVVDSAESMAITQLIRAPTATDVFASSTPVEMIKRPSQAEKIQPATFEAPEQSHVLLSYELNRLGYLVYGGKFLMSYDDWYVLTSMAPLRVVEKLWNYRISVLDITKSEDGRYFHTQPKSRFCRVDEPELQAIPWYEVTVCAFH